MSLLNKKETIEWRELYRNDAELIRRRQAMPKKLRQMGILNLDRNISILDTCCGHGETLDTLYEMGFRKLHGVDIEINENLKKDVRFEIVECDAKNTPWSDSSFDLILNIHALHHLGPKENIKLFLDECLRLLKKGGRLGIVDFPNSLPIQLAFHYFYYQIFLPTSYMKRFSRLLREEWHIVVPYLKEWSAIRKMLFKGKYLVEKHSRGLFYYNCLLVENAKDKQ